MSDLWRRSASELAALIARKEVSSREVVEAHLARIATVNPKLNAVVKVLAEEAHMGADEADRKVAAKDALGPLHGVPFTIKENIDLAGAATTWGLPAFRAPWFPSTRQSSRGCAQQGRCRSGGPICQTWGCAFTRTVPYTASRAILGMRDGPQAVRAVEKR